MDWCPLWHTVYLVHGGPMASFPSPIVRGVGRSFPPPISFFVVWNSSPRRITPHSGCCDFCFSANTCLIFFTIKSGVHRWILLIFLFGAHNSFSGKKSTPSHKKSSLDVWTDSYVLVSSVSEHLVPSSCLKHGIGDNPNRKNNRLPARHYFAPFHTRIVLLRLWQNHPAQLILHFFVISPFSPVVFWAAASPSAIVGIFYVKA